MAVDIRTAMTDPALFGDTFGGDSFTAWRALLSGFYGLELDATELDMFKTLTGRQTAPQGPHDELWLAVGRRGGKSYAAGFLAVFLAAFHDYRDSLAPGEIATVMVIAADRKQARAVMRYTSGLMNSNPMLRRMILRENSEQIELNNRTVIEITTASHRSVRGYTLAAVIADEIAFWHSEGANPDVEIIAALRPALATLGGRLIGISSPYARRGVLWDTYRRHYGQDSDRVLVAQAPSRTMNPLLPQRVVDDAMKDDAARASAEYLAQFRSDIETFLSLELVAMAQRQEPMEIPRQRGVKYWAFVDPSGGGADEFTIAIGHREKGEAIILDAVRGRKGNPAAITADYCALLKTYGITKVYGDRYGAEWVRTEFRRHTVAYLDSPGTRSELYLSMGQALNAARVELPPCPMIERQLCALERRTSRGGRDLIDHPPGGHDDRANAAAGLVALLGSDKRKDITSRTSTVKGLY
ncbi:hypothetical protein [Sulfitobacter guttiformis]|uniref:Phage terminase large subunit-like protein n=1 Tax=Sulfitobacter guttiformis TaxID=74349 RepID=A0A420DMU3_9RHOB|nr:hypothetical protein [Sulfitobacter guttiformis]KIN72788.1 hypothetical protein Z949_1968 [Sulfitobacter guttiformis KCTC 32187]RKE95479.1 hypothetical protein C8N30_0014 [Sulfitobacter guttiformis]